MFVVAVIGKNPFKDSLNEIARKKVVKNKRIVVKYIYSINDIGNANILFIPKSEKKLLNSILKITKGKPILLISEIPKSMESGVHINFFLNKQMKIRFEINTKSLKESKLKMSSFLIDIANNSVK